MGDVPAGASAAGYTLHRTTWLHVGTKGDLGQTLAAASEHTPAALQVQWMRTALSCPRGPEVLN